MKTDQEVRKELWDIADGTSDEDVSVCVPLADYQQIGGFATHVEGDNAWVPVRKLREVVLRNARHHMFDEFKP